MSKRTSYTTCLLLLLSACREAPVDAPKVTATALTPAVAAIVLPAPDPKLARLPLADRLALEASARPAEAVRAESLMHALEERGVSLARKRQVLASTLGASYCELAISNAGLGVSLCEYADDATAQAGSQRSHELFDTMVPGRTLAVRGNTLLTLTHPESDDAKRQVDLITAVFSHQTPSPLETKTALAH